MRTGFDAFKENGYRDVRMTAEASYHTLIEYKTEKLMVPLFGETTTVGSIPPLAKELYVEKIYNHYKYLVMLSNAMTDDKKTMVENFMNSFTPTEILNNRTERPITFGGRTYQVGTKVFRLLHKFGELNDALWSFDNKVYGELALQQDKVKPIFISIRPEHFIQAADAGDSCLSLGGEHEDSALAYPTLPYSMVAYTEDLSWRAFVYFSKEDGVFTQMPGYPRENFYAQLAVRNFFESKGYEITSQYRFNHGFFQDSDVFHARVSSIIGKQTIKIEKFLDRDIYSGHKIKSSDYKNIIAAYCDGCDKVRVGYHTFDVEGCPSCISEAES